MRALALFACAEFVFQSPLQERFPLQVALLCWLWRGRASRRATASRRPSGGCLTRFFYWRRGIGGDFQHALVLGSCERNRGSRETGSQMPKRTQKSRLIERSSIYRIWPGAPLVRDRREHTAREAIQFRAGPGRCPTKDRQRVLGRRQFGPIRPARPFEGAVLQ
jgi:hypothetical protein